MSSGEILFILAFIVLPTAVLVSSAWAVLFVRRRPDRVVEQQPGDPGWDDTPTTDDHVAIQDTAVMNTAVATEEEPALAEAEIAESYPPDEGVEAIEEDLADDEETLIIAPVAISEPEPDEETGEEPAVVQTTDDLNAVVAKVQANEIEEQRAEELEPPIHETTELPVLPPRDPEPGRAQELEHTEETTAVAPEEQDETAGLTWRRRKRPAQLRPADPDAARQRSRGRESQRQVPQLGRTARRRDGNQRDTSENPEESGGTL